MLLCGCDFAGNSKEYSANFFAMDTYMTLTAYGKGAKEAVEEAEGEIHAVVRQSYLLAFRHIVIEECSLTWCLQFTIDEEVGDSQFQQRASLVGQFITVYDVVSVERTKQNVVVTSRNGSPLREHRIVNAVQLRERGEYLFAFVYGLCYNYDILIIGFQKRFR